MSSAIQTLICGPVAAIASDEHDEKTTVLVGLGRLVDSYYGFALEFKKNITSPQASYFLPVALRSLIETSTIAFLGRIDPLRVIHSSKSQDNANYNKSRQQASALKWKGDIVTDDNPNQMMWDPNVGTQKLPRALLCEQSCEALWIPAAKNSVKWLSANLKDDSIWLRELLASQPEDFQKQTVGTGNRLYSELSKGIHPEFAVRREVEFDEATLRTAFDNSMKWLSNLAFISHFSPGLSVGLESEKVLQHFLSIEAQVNE